MNKRIYATSLLVALMVVVALAVENEFIKNPKEKKFYPSCSQSVELAAELIGYHVEVQQLLNDIQGLLLQDQKSQLSCVSDYYNGDKEAFLQKATKDERADRYAADRSRKNALQDIKSGLRQMKELWRTSGKKRSTEESLCIDKADTKV